MPGSGEGRGERVAAAPGVYSADVDDEVIVFIEGSGELLRLNPAAAMVWRSIGGSRSPGDVAARIAAATGRSVGEVTPEVDALMEDLEATGVVVRGIDAGATSGVRDPHHDASEAPSLGVAGDRPEGAGSAGRGPGRLEAAGAMLVQGATAVRVIEALRARGLDPILLKGPSLAGWLYDDPLERRYRDIDLLVRPDRYEAAEAILEELGFEHEGPSLPVRLVEPHAAPWRRPADGAIIDLHRYLFGARSDAAAQWRMLDGRREEIELVGHLVDGLDETARLMHLCLHAAQDHFSRGKKIDELDRALNAVDAGEWPAAAELARQMHAEASMGVGLRQTPQGRELADRLGLPAMGDAELTLRSQGAHLGAVNLVHVLRAPFRLVTWRYVLRKLFPPRDFVAEWAPFPVEGPASWVRAYARRFAVIVGETVRQLPVAVRSLRRSRDEEA